MPATPSAEEIDAIRSDLDARLAAHDRGGAVRVTLEAVADGRIGVEDLYVHVIGPLMVATGAAWQSGGVRVWEEHFASATMRIIVDALYPHVLDAAEQAQSRLGTVVLACPPEEEHDLGLRMLADRFEMAGWKTYYLGANTPVAEIVEASRTLAADLVVLSAATHFHRMSIADTVAHLRRELAGVRLVVGGAAFEAQRGDWPAEEIFDARIITEGPRAGLDAGNA